MPLGTYKYLAVAAAVLALVGAAKLYVSRLESAAYDRGRAELQVIIDAADQQAKETQQRQEADNAKLKAEYEQRVAKIEKFYADKSEADIRRLRDEYARRLQLADEARAGSTAVGNTGDDAPAGESTVTGCPESVERACVLDANMVNTWRAWATRHGIPVKD